MTRPRRPFRRSAPATLLAVAAALLAQAPLAPLHADGASPDKRPVARQIRGRYLVEAGGCGDCHTPLTMGSRGPEPDMSRMLSGHPHDLEMPPAPTLPPGPWMVVSSATNTAFAGPWGVSFSANLTPDDETGLGNWSEQDFVQTFRTGRHLGVGRAVLPPMPIPAYNHFDDRDLEAIYAYLRTIPPIDNRVPEPSPPAVASLPK